MKNVYEVVIEPIVDSNLRTMFPATLTNSLWNQCRIRDPIAEQWIQFYHSAKDQLHHTFDGNEWDIFQEVLPIALETRRLI